MDAPQFDLAEIQRRVSPQAQAEIHAALLSIQLEQAHARIAELEATTAESQTT